MALGQTFNLAQIYGAAEGVKGARAENQLRQQQLDLQQVIQDTGRAAVDPKTGQYSPTKQAQALTAAGYPQAGEQLLTQQIDKLTKINAYAEKVLPYATAESYPKIKASLERIGVQPGVLPDQYDPQFIQQSIMASKGLLSDAMSGMKELYSDQQGNLIVGQQNKYTGEVSNLQKFQPKTGPRPVAVPNGDGTVTYRDPAGLTGTTAKANPSAASNRPFRFTASDTNSIYRQAVGLFGGLYDPTTQQISGLDPQQMSKVQAVAARASKIYREGGGEVDHASAVEQALAEVSRPPAGQSQGASQAPGQPPANRPPLSSFRAR